MSITVNSKVFETIRYPSPTSVLLRTLSRGVTLPDTLLIANRSSVSKIDPAVTDNANSASFHYTYIDTVTGKAHVGQASVSLKLPSNMGSSDQDALFADLTDYLASAITLRAANVARLKSGALV